MSQDVDDGFTPPLHHQLMHALHTMLTDLNKATTTHYNYRKVMEKCIIRKLVHNFQHHYEYHDHQCQITLVIIHTLFKGKQENKERKMTAK